MILEQGMPFLTLIWMKGHIMLYIGNEHGRALVFHEFWGIKTGDFWVTKGEGLSAMPRSPRFIQARSSLIESPERQPAESG